MRLILTILLIAGIGAFAWWVQDLQISKWNLSYANKQKDTLLIRRNQTIQGLNDRLDTLTLDTARKAAVIGNLRASVSELQKSQQGAQTRYLQARVNQLPVSSQLVQQIASYDAKQKKLAADELVDGIGEMGLSVNDSVANGKIATLKGKHKNLVTVYVPSLEEANASLSQQKIDLDTQLALERSHGQDLVDEVNGKNKAFNRLQSVTQSQISKAQKGLLGPVLHGPRIKSLQVVSDSISKVQK